MSEIEENIPIDKMIDINGVQIHYKEAGNGKCLVLLHAAGHDLRDFDSIYDSLSKTYRVIAVDLPGHGESQVIEPPSSINILKLTEIIQGFAQIVVQEPAIYIGNSVGGYISISLALAQPDNVKGLVLINSGGFNEPSFITNNFTHLKGKEWITNLLWNIFPDLYIKIKNKYTTEILNRIKLNKNKNSVETNASIWRSFLYPEHDLREKAKQVQSPTLLIWGKRDPVIELKIGIHAAQTIPDARLELMNTGHLPFAEDPEKFLSILEPFLNTIQ